MDLRDKEKVIANGKNILNNGFFPDELLESISEKRLRDDISKKVFQQKKVRFEDLKPEEQLYRKLRLHAKMTFDDYLESILIFKNISYLLIIIGAITWFTSFIGANDNADHGIFSLIVGFLLFILTLRLDHIKTYIKIALISYSTITLMELIILGIPDKYLLIFTQFALEARGSVIITILNVISPFVYIGIRLMIIWFLYKVFKNLDDFTKAKDRFENPAANIV
jgi:hypothetical protein